MHDVEILLRGGAIGLCAFISIKMVASRFRHPSMVFGALFAGGVAIYAYLSSPLGRPWTIPMLPFIFVSTLNPAFFWLFVRALIDDRLEWSWLNIGVVLVQPCLFVLGYFVADDWTLLTGSMLHIATIVIFMATAFIALQDIGLDLVNKRRWFRFALVILIPITGLAVATAEIIQMSLPLPEWLFGLQAATLLMLSLFIALWITNLDDAIIRVSSSPTNRSGVLSPAGSIADTVEIRKLRKMVESGALFEESMTVGRLAERMSMPEHRLRRLINGEMGYRNFAAFLNNHRVDEAMTRLTDVNRLREQIVQIAFSLGYSSLAPFNKAFRERTGMSPTEYRDCHTREPDQI